MASKRFLMVPVDSSAASRPLPGATMAKATLLRSARFIDASSRALDLCESKSLQVKIDGSRAIPKKHARPREAGGPLRCGWGSRDLRIELALDVALRHFGGGQHLLDLAGLACGIEFLQPLFAKPSHRLHRGFEIFARIEFLRIVVQYLSYLPGHRHAVVGVDVDLADAVLDAALDLGNRHAPGRLHLAAIGVDDVLQVLRHRG